MSPQGKSTRFPHLVLSSRFEVSLSRRAECGVESVQGPEVSTHAAPRFCEFKTWRERLPQIPMTSSAHPAENGPGSY